MQAILFRQQLLKASQPSRAMHLSRVLREDAARKHHAQTATKRFARLRNVPAELVPLAAVLALGVGAALFSMGRALFTDPTLRLMPSKKAQH